MLTPQEAYSAAILRACEAHLARVKAARDTRVLAVSMARKTLAEHEHTLKKRCAARKRNAPRMEQSPWPRSEASGRSVGNRPRA